MYPFDPGSLGQRKYPRRLRKRWTIRDVAWESQSRATTVGEGKSDYNCEYRDEGDLSRESKELVVEVTRILAQLPEPGRVRVLQELGEESSAWTILSTLRQRAADSRQEQSDASGSIQSSTGDEMEDPFHGWESQNPVAYPDREDTQPAVMRADGTTVEPRRTNSDITERPASRVSGPEKGSAIGDVTLCDPRLSKLNIRHWTSVDISDDLAAKCISLYLQTDHPLLGHFDPELFVSSLISEKHEYCSSLLINAMLYWACQMYSAIDPQTDALATAFCVEAEILWTAEREMGHDSTLTLAAAEFLCMGYLGQGRDHAVLTYLAEATDMAGRMGLFSSEAQGSSQETRTFPHLTGAAKAAHMYAAWGIFNWLTLMSLFYHQPGMLYPSSPPLIAVPKGPHVDTTETSLVLPAEVVSWVPAYMGDTFPYLCWFWTIVREMTWVYYVGGQTTLGSHGSLAFAEFKFRELLAWTNSLPPQLLSKQYTPHHVQVMHIWFHACVLDLFRPFIGRGHLRYQRLRTFASNTCSPSAICATSTAQLKKLIVNYRLNYESSNVTILWHTALIYVANAILETNPKDKDWYTYLLHCLYGYKSLSQSWRVAKSITKGLLSLTIRKGGMSSEKASQILRDLENNDTHQMPGEIRATFMLDLDRALSEPDTATVEYLANQFEDNVIMERYTNLFDKNPN
ncbi:hypothetical protein E4U27_003741 [Claviceps purpurea]|nr:hypothetical protein E4U27_003741 [Claviceps purpurea]